MKNNMNILVTGGAGYIGSHTCKALAAAGFLPVVYDNFSQGHDWAVQWGPCVRGDLADSMLLQKTMLDCKVQAVLHFAAHAYVGESMQKPEKYFRNNVVNSLNLLEAMQTCHVNRMIFSSSCATYGIPESMPVCEDTPQQPVNPYGESKRMVEKMLQWLEMAHGLQWVALRYFNAAGADPEGQTGESHQPETHLIPLLIQAALNPAQPVRIYGQDYPTPDGTCQRDYIHVSDLASAHTAALQYLLDGGQPGAFNLGTGKAHSVLEVVRMVEEISGRKVPCRMDVRRPGDPPVLFADPARAKRILGWEPQFSSLRQIIQTAWNWHSKNPDK